MRTTLITLLFLLSVSITDAQSRVVRLDDDRKNVISSEIIILNFDGDSNVKGVDIDGYDLVTDTDSDGLSDYIEKNVYFTDMNNISTVGDSRTDVTKLLLGLDPLSESPLEFKYEDIRANSSATELIELKVSDIRLINGKIGIRGTGLPNSLTTIYIFDIGLVITIPTDANGNWEYFLAKEVVDGRYDVYLGILNTEGSVVAKSEKNTFSQQAGQVVLNPTPEPIDFDLFRLFIDYFLWIIGGIFMFGSLIVGLLIWKNTEVNRRGGE